MLIVFGKNIPDTTGHQMTVQVATSPNFCFCNTYRNRTGKIWVEINIKMSVNFISPNLWPPTASIRSLTMFAVSCSSESIGSRLEMSMNSISDWLKFGALSTLLSMNGDDVRQHRDFAQSKIKCCNELRVLKTSGSILLLVTSTWLNFINKVKSFKVKSFLLFYVCVRTKGRPIFHIL